MEKEKPFKTIKEVIEYHEDFIRKFLKERGKIIPQIISCKRNNMAVIVCLDGRDGLKNAMEASHLAGADWIVGLYEAYMSQEKPEVKDTYEHGQLTARAKVGDKKIKDVVVMYVVFGKEKRMLSYLRIKGNKIRKLYDIKDTEGYLTLGG